jgi:NRPS condensation-like uncharacterized protein
MMFRNKKKRRYPAPAQDQFMYIVRDLHDAQSRCILTFTEPLDENRLSQAFLLSLRAEPVLGCRFVPRPLRPYWQLRDDLVEIARCKVFPAEEIEQDCYRFLAEPIRPEQDPQIQMRIFRGRYDALCIKINHMVTDGSGLLEYLQLFGGIYDALGRHVSSLPLYDNGPSRGMGGLFRAVGVRRLVRGWRNYRLPLSTLGFPSRGLDFSGRTFAIRRLPAERLDALKVYSRRSAASLNLILHTAFFRALFRLVEPPCAQDIPIEATLSLRPFVPNGRAGRISNLAGAFFPAMPRVAGESFAGTLERLKAIFAQADAEEPWLGTALTLEAMFVFGFRVAEGICQYLRRHVTGAAAMHPFFANLGKIDPRQVDFGDAKVHELILLGPVPFPPGSLLSVYSWKETLFLTSGYCETAVDAAVIERFFDLFTEELPGMEPPGNSGVT